MSTDQVQQWREAIRKRGWWATLRQMDKQGVPFTEAHTFYCGYPPRFKLRSRNSGVTA